MVHHGKDHWDVSTLEGQQFDSSQVWHGTVETEAQQGENQIMLSVLRETHANVLDLDSSHNV